MALGVNNGMVELNSSRPHPASTRIAQTAATYFRNSSVQEVQRQTWRAMSDLLLLLHHLRGDVQGKITTQLGFRSISSAGSKTGHGWLA